MRFAAPFRVLLTGAGVACLLLLAPHQASAQPAPQPVRVDDSTLNGIVAGGTTATAPRNEAIVMSGPGIACTAP